MERRAMLTYSMQGGLQPGAETPSHLQLTPMKSGGNAKKISVEIYSMAHLSLSGRCTQI